MIPDQDFRDLWHKIDATPVPTHMFVAAVPFAMLRAGIEFHGRDRRRVKREMNKAAKKAKSPRH